MPVSSNAKDALFRDWCKKDGVSQLQATAVYPPKHCYQAGDSQPLHRSHRRPQNPTPAGVEREPYELRTDRMATYVPPEGTQLRRRDPTKFDALGRTGGWGPHTSNAAGAQRAVYDPVSHKTTLYTFDRVGGVSWVEGQGDGLMRDKAKADASQGGVKWHGSARQRPVPRPCRPNPPRSLRMGRARLVRSPTALDRHDRAPAGRKGVVEFVDRTHRFAVNKNDEFVETCLRNEHAYHTPTGELTKWMDNAFASKMKVPFYEKRPYEMNR